MDGVVRSQMCRALFAELGVPIVTAIDTIRVCRLSGVERLHLPDGSTRVFKHSASPPFTSEHWTLAHLAEQGIPVPHLRACATSAAAVAMILDDLGEPTRDPTLADAAAIAVQLHAARPATWLPRLDETALANLPKQALRHLAALRSEGRYLETDDVIEHLVALSEAAPSRAAGAGKQPWGFCHGELHHSAVHISDAGRHVLDLAMACTGPGVFDLAAWTGLRQPADHALTRQLIDHYIAAGGHPDAAADRGGLPAEAWALGWHRVQAASWLLECAAGNINGHSRDLRNLHILQRQLTDARGLLNV